MWRSDIEIKGFSNIDSSIARRVLTRELHLRGGCGAGGGMMSRGEGESAHLIN